MRRVLPFAEIWLVTTWLCVLPALAPAQVAAVPHVDTTNRGQVASFYRLYYRPTSMVPLGWTGSVAAGIPGTLSPDFVRATLRRINYYRAMTGLPGNVVFSRDENARCQETALMMAAQQAVSHKPARDWRFYTPAAAETAAHADLDLNHGDMGPGAIDRYIADFGRENGGVGHRRWLLYNAAHVMGIGAVPAEGRVHPGANVTYVGGPSTSPLGAPLSAAWPPAGFVPAPLVYDRWSFSYDGADFRSAAVHVTKNGVPVAVRRERVHFQMLADGAGSVVGNNTFVWTLPGNVVSRSADESYRVQVDHVYIDGVRRQFDYTVTSIDPGEGRVAVTSHRKLPAKASPERTSPNQPEAPFPDADALLD